MDVIIFQTTYQILTLLRLIRSNLMQIRVYLCQIYTIMGLFEEKLRGWGAVIKNNLYKPPERLENITKIGQDKGARKKVRQGGIYCRN